MRPRQYCIAQKPRPSDNLRKYKKKQNPYRNSYFGLQDVFIVWILFLFILYCTLMLWINVTLTSTQLSLVWYDGKDGMISYTVVA